MGQRDDDIAAVRSIDIVPTILDTVCRLTGMGFSAVARVTETRWIACEVLDKIEFGLKPGGELALETTICHEIRQSAAGVVISDVQTDTIYREHHTPAMYGFRSYISFPIIRADGSIFGTLCAIDPEPRDLARPEVQATFQMFAKLLAFHLDTSERLTVAEDALAGEVQSGELREQFIAVVGHDLRNPISAIDAGIVTLRTQPAPARTKLILDQMEGSVRRMTSLIENILDFARGRLGGGLTLDFRTLDIIPVIEQVAGELAASHPERQIDINCRMGLVLTRCDPQRIGQLLSNLIGNAITHGAPDEPITISCAIERDVLELSVSNGGREIPASSMIKLFHPFARGSAAVGREGLGLGLYIASEIATAHGGKLSVASSPERTVFTFSMPLAG